MAFKYLIYDIESIVDRALLNRVVYAGDGLWRARKMPA